MKTRPTVRVIRAFNGWRVGQTFQPFALQRDHLIAGGFVELVKAAAPVVRAEVPLPQSSKAKRKAASSGVAAGGIV